MEWQGIKAGIPQHPILDLLLFLVYTNDLPEGLKSSFKLYPEHNSIFSTVKDPTKSSNELNSDFKINIRTFQWKMAFNCDPLKKATDHFFKKFLI